MDGAQPNDASLLTPESMGGIFGGRGYEFQDAFIVSRIPEWLAEPSFTMLLKEGAGDVEVRFDSNGTKRYFYQVKNHQVSPAECKDVITAFFTKDSQSPGTYEKFILACRGLMGNAGSFRRALERLQDVGSFYGSVDRVLTDTKAAIVRQARKVGLISVPLDFLRQKVFFDTELGDMRSDARLCEQFIGSIERNIPKWSTVGGPRLGAAYREVARLVNASIGKALSRIDVETTVQQAIDAFPVRSQQEGVRVRLYHWEGKGKPFDLSEPWDILLDWSEHFDRDSRMVPDTEIWRDTLIPALGKAEKDLRASTSTRLIHFCPSACLSAGLALGWAFKRVRHYGFEVEQGDDIWRTSVQPAADRHLIAEITSLYESSRDLCVEFNQAFDVSLKVNQFTHYSGRSFRARLRLIPDVRMGRTIDGAIALKYADDAKQQIRKAIDSYGCNVVHLFYAGPLGLAIFVGRLFNAMHADIQCYEEQKVGYKPTCLLRGD